MQSSHAIPPSSSSSKAKRSGGGLQGPRPQPLSLSATASASTRPSKKPRCGGGSAAGPVIVYERTPRVVHARPHEFMAVVQRLTGRQMQQSLSTAAALPVAAGARDYEATTTAGEDALVVLTLGQQQRRPAPPCDEHSAMATCPSPATGSLLSPTSSFLFSPTTMQAIQELIG